MKISMTMLILGVVLAGCAGGSHFYSFRQLNFVPHGPPHEALTGRWHASNGRSLVLAADGRYSHAGSGGCWDADGAKVFFVWGCVNYGATRGDPMLAVAEAWAHCDYALADALVLKNCSMAGEYRRMAGVAL